MLAALLCGLPGCGARDYEQKFQTSLDVYQRETPFKELLKSYSKMSTTDEDGGPLLAIRLPKMYGEKNSYALDTRTADPRHPDTPLNPNRVQPEFIQLPGYVRTYEHHVQMSGQSGALFRPVYAYLAMTDAGEQSLEDLKDDLRSQLVQRFGELPDEEDEEEAKAKPRRRGQEEEVPVGVSEWETVNLPSADGGTREWDKITAQGEQTFQYYNSKNEVLDKHLPAKYLLYVRSDEGYHVMIAWRILWTVDKKVMLEGLADASVGSVRIGEFAEASAEDDAPDEDPAEE